MSQTCQKYDRETETVCGLPAIRQDIHRRPLCEGHYTDWESRWAVGSRQRMTKEKTNVILRPHDLFITDLDPLVKLLHHLTDNTGTAEDIAEAVQGCHWLLLKLKN